MKPLKLVQTNTYADYYNFVQMLHHQNAFNTAWNKNHCDFYLFDLDEKTGFVCVTMQGYEIDETGEETGKLVEGKELVHFKHKSSAIPFKKFWVKVDNYGDYFLVTFLFPEDY